MRHRSMSPTLLTLATVSDAFAEKSGQYQIARRVESDLGKTVSDTVRLS